MKGGMNDVRNRLLGELVEKIRRRARWYSGRFQVNNPLIGRVVELAGDRVRMDGMTYSVASPNITRGHKSTLLFGLHEIEERRLIKSWLPPELPLVELGGGLGVVSCLANQIIRDPSRHVVVEANPYMVQTLERNRELNGRRFQVVNRAIGYDADRVSLAIDPEFVGSNLAAAGQVAESIEVPTTSVLRVVEDAGFDEFSLIADIEGLEAEVIRREVPAFGDRLRFAMFEMHPFVLGGTAVDELMRKMEQSGFRELERLGDDRVFCVAYGRA